ncbi:RHS repeat-associated core domain-containing protein [Pseudomonas monteilii]|uniref:RHS repeat-associated core domain-containing protein n=1 Tax=Pseudomonas monteilii TaxID=76759 RepID=UPI003CFBFB93
MALSRLYFYQGKQPNMVLSDQLPSTFFRNGSQPLAESIRFNNVSSSVFTLNDANNSVINTSTGRSVNYTPFGYTPRQQSELVHQAYNGHIHVPLELYYLLGNGRRAYDPVLMRFRSVDTDSPFASGGINAYAYCGGDPINYSDPSARARASKKNGATHPAPSRATRKQSGSIMRTRSQNTSHSTDEIFNDFQDLIQNEKGAITTKNLKQSDIEAFFKSAHQAAKDPWIKLHPANQRVSEIERTAIQNWASTESNVGLAAANAWLDAQTLDLDPLHTISLTNRHDRAAAKRTHNNISSQLHFIRFGY